MVSFVFSSFVGMFFNFSAISIVAAVPSFSSVRLFATPWTTALQASLSFTISWSLLKFMSIESMISSNHLILYHPLLLLPSVFSSIRVFSNELVLCIRWPKYCSFSFSISPSSEYSGLISFRTDWWSSCSLRDSQVYGPTCTSVHDYWKNQYVFVIRNTIVFLV